MIKRFFPFLFLTMISLANAAQDVTVIKDNSPVRQDPNESGKIIDYLQEGEDMRISNFPLNQNYYKVRAKNGQYGWVHKKYLSIATKSEEELAAAVANEPAEPEKEKLFFVRAFGGGDFFRPQDLNDVFTFNELNFGYYTGGEFGYYVGSRFALVVRSEVLLKDVVAREVTTQRVYNLSLRSYPIMAGVEYMFLKNFPFRMSVGIYAGAAVNTTFAAEALSLAPDNRSVFGGTPFTTLAKINVIRPLGRMFSIFAETGYRFLKTDAFDTTNTVNGGEVFKISGYYKSRVIDMSGFILGAGIGFHF